MAVYLTGDIHGMLDDRFEVWNFPEGEELTHDDYLIILGDFSMPYDMLEDDSGLRELNAKPWTTLFIDGNHEQHDYLASLPESEWHGGIAHRYPGYRNIIHLIRGEVYEIDGRTFFCMGGAQSMDKAIQQEWGTWHPEEMPDEAEYANAEQNLARHDWEVDFVLTHTCANRMLETAIGGNGFANTEIITDELTDFLDNLEDRLQYKHWFFGHLHSDCDLDDRHTLLFQSIVDLDDYE